MGKEEEETFQMVGEGPGGKRFLILTQLHVDIRLFFQRKGLEATFTILVNFPQSRI